VYVTAHREGDGPVLWSLGVYEVVPGAEVVGQAEPGARIEASLPLAADGGFAHVYRAVTEADATGRWSLRLPYGNDGVPGGAIRVGRSYSLASGEERRQLAVPEAAVRAGDVVEGPAFGRGE
jgi:hypothetical protein